MVLGFIVIFGLRKRLLIEFISIIKTLAKEMSTYDRLAAFILNNYQGVLITRIDVDGNLNGYVFKRIGELLRSEAIVIASDSYAPVFLSRRETTVISDDIRNYPSINKFDEKYVFPRKNAGSID